MTIRGRGSSVFHRAIRTFPNRRRFAGRCSRGELEALKAICHLCCFSALIDELSFGAAWDALSHAHGDTRRLLAACILDAP